MGATVQDLMQETATIKGAQPIPVPWDPWLVGATWLDVGWNIGIL